MRIQWALTAFVFGVLGAATASAQIGAPQPTGPAPRPPAVPVPQQPAPPRPAPPTAPPTTPPTQPAPAPVPPTQPEPAPPPITPAPRTGLGSALPGLTAEQLAAFNAGNVDFQTVETPASGLGPFFNERSCVACHRSPAPGGVTGDPNRIVTRFGRLVDGRFDPMTELGGSLLQNRSIDPRFIEVVPATATIEADRITTPVFGLGLIEAIPDATIQAIAARTKPDGVRGRAAIVNDVASGQNRVGKFGWKAQHATILSFTGDAYLNEMGITNRLFTTENAPNGDLAKLALANTRVTFTGLQDRPNPATGLSKIDRVTAYMKFLAPPAPPTLSASATAGQTLFNQIGCAVCHTPSMQTGTNPVAALSQKPVRLYSDLLLHNMGSLNDGVAQDGAGANEMKTAPLWGLRTRPLWLHDGRARTIAEAITAHDGEGAASKNRYQALTPAQRRQLLDFLNAI